MLFFHFTFSLYILIFAFFTMFFYFSIRRSENMEREGRPGNLDVQIVGKIMGTKG
jgi:hypothetical protein